MMVKNKKKQSRSQSYTEKNPKKTVEHKLLSIFQSKLASGKDMEHMFRGMSSKPAPGLSSQSSRVVRCPKCHKFLQEPLDVTIYKCSGCDSILQAKRWELENNDKSIRPGDVLSSQYRSLTPVRSSYRKYSSRTSPCVERGYHSETAYRRHETSYVPREWMTRPDEFSVTRGFASARSSPGVVKLSITTKKEDTTLLDLLRFSDYGTRFAEETVAIHHQDSASDGRHLSSSDKGSGDRICKSTDAANLETFGDKRSEEDMRSSRSSEFIDLKLEAFQPQWKHKLREQQPASRIHLEQSEEESAEGGGSKTPVRSSYRKFSSRASPLLERGYHSERRHETTSYIRREWMTSASPSPSSYGYTSSPFHGSQVSASERSSYHQREGWFQEFSSSAATSPIRSQGETSDQKCYHWSTQQSQLHDSQLSITNKEETVLDLFVDSGTSFAQETVVVIHHPDPASDGHLSSSDKGSGDSVCIRTDAVKWETFDDSGIKEDIRSISSKFIDLTFQPRWNHKLRGQETLLGDGSGLILAHKNERMIDSRIETETVADRLVSHSVEPLNKKEHVCETNVLSENTRDTQEFDLGELKWEDIMGKKPQYTGDSICDSSISSKFYDLKLEAFQPWLNHKGRASEEGCIVSLKKASEAFKSSIEDETGEERSAFQHMESPKEKFDSNYQLGGERTWAEAMEDRVGLHLEEYETNYENYRNPFEWTPAFDMPEYELGTILEPEEEAQGKSEYSSRNPFCDQESSEGSSVIGESQDAKPDQSQYDKSNERQELSNTVFDIVRSELQEGRYHTNETFERRGDASKRTWTEVMGDGPWLQLEGYQSNPNEWTSERAPTFRQHEHELGTMPEPEKDVSGRTIYSSIHFFDDHESSKEKVVAREEAPWLVVDDNRTEELKVGVMVEDGPSLPFEKCGYESTKLEETFGFTETTPMFCLHEPELLEPDNEADGSSESRSKGSFNSHESSELRAVFHQEEDPQVMSDSRTEMVSVKLEDIFEWTSQRAPTFRLHEPKLGALLEPEEEAQGRSESSSRGSFNDHVVSKEREIYHEEDSRLVIDYETKAVKVGVMAEDGPSLHLEKFENEKKLLDQRGEPREDIFRLSLDDTVEQEWVTFDSETSQEDKEVNPRQRFKQGGTEENTPASGSMVSSEVESEAEEEILRYPFEHLQKENEIVGLRHALYQTQTSPLRSPLSSPICTPIGSPRQILMRSRTASPMHSHIVSPLRSSIISSSGSYSDVLFLAKKT